MTAKKLGLIFSVCMASIICVAKVYALGREGRMAHAMYQDSGNTGIPFNTACSTSAWTEVVSTDSIKRAWFIQVSTSQLSAVCLSTTTNSGDACNENTNGAMLGSVAGAVNFLIDYSGIDFYCRALGTAIRVRGYWTRDTGDYGATGLAR